MHEKLIILDFGLQTTQLTSHRIRELDMYCEIVPYNKFPHDATSAKSVILPGSPYSICDGSAFKADLIEIRGKYPALDICYGTQFPVYTPGGNVEPANSREHGRINLSHIDGKDELLKRIHVGLQIWMPHGDAITVLPDNFRVIASTDDVRVVAYHVESEQTWGAQFHPEVFHSIDDTRLLDNSLNIRGCVKDWTPASFIESTVAELKEQLGDDKVISVLFGGVDLSVMAVLLNKATGKNLICISVDHGLLRKNELGNVMGDYEHLGLNVIGVNAKDKFYKGLAGVTGPEKKRKITGKGFTDVFDEEAHKLEDTKWLGQGTTYPDVIESLSITGTVIKGHHNVGGLLDTMNLKLVEPLRFLFKDEVRRVGAELGMQPHLIKRHPLPGPGLGIHILDDITLEKVRIPQGTDNIYMSSTCEWGLYDKIWQAGVILLPIQSIDVMGDERTYENTVALCVITSTDVVTADWAQLPYEFLARVSNEIINKVRGVNRVVYDISSKPPATIEWE